MMQRRYKWKVGLLLLLLGIQLAQAKSTGDDVKFSFEGRLQAIRTACQITNGKGEMIETVFGNVGINKVASGQYIKPLDYQLSNCGSGSNAIFMTFKAIPSGFDETAISTNVNGLGVKILKDGQPLKLNETFKIVDAPQLQVQLVKDPAITLQAIPFTAIGTLVVEYI